MPRRVLQTIGAGLLIIVSGNIADANPIIVMEHYNSGHLKFSKTSGFFSSWKYDFVRSLISSVH